MKTLASLRALAAILFCGAGLRALDPASDPLRFLHVEKYQGRLLISSTGEGTVDIQGNIYKCKADRHADIALELIPTLPDNPVVQVWRGILDGTSSASRHDQVIFVTNSSSCIHDERWEGAGPLTASDEASVKFQLSTEGGVLAPVLSLTGLLDVDDHVYLSGGAGCSTDDYSSPVQMPLYPFLGPALPGCPTSPYGFPITCIDFPESGVLIRQTWDFFANDYVGSIEVPGLHHSITLELSGEVEDLEVVVTPGDHANWLPQARSSETEEGNTIQINAKLQKKGGGMPSKHAEQFIFELTQVSREPGVCLNYPV